MNTELLEIFQTDSFGEIQETIQFWLEECSLDQAPTATEVAQWLDILDKRGGKFVQLAKICQDYLHKLDK